MLPLLLLPLVVVLLLLIKLLLLRRRRVELSSSCPHWRWRRLWPSVSSRASVKGPGRRDEVWGRWCA